MVEGQTSNRNEAALSSKRTSKTVKNSPITSRSITLSFETYAISKPITPTLSSFSQSTNIINITINYAGADFKSDAKVSAQV
ncbi:6452_t:CDS:2 [Funneliformis caledonium]|uniref:6452_t:CDS:1 n=1 Tax=Funneliformis caledonium TaxID=1117310 RepID=A0A9N9HE64_9GLOM|nr:6452_t:CDS:2 [Funneliformis caledonium]